MVQKTIVMCLDGTWNDATMIRKVSDDGSGIARPTNVLKVARTIEPSDAAGSKPQITYYDPGVGATDDLEDDRNMLEKLSLKIEEFTGGLWGAGFETKIYEAITFLSLNHSTGDSIYVFGFSRGAATARALTHFIDWMGGIPGRDNAYFLPFFFNLYLNVQGEGTLKSNASSLPDAQKPKKGKWNIQPAEITYLGLWDSVLSLGARTEGVHGTSGEDLQFHVKDTPADCVKNLSHAISIDEERIDFRPEVFANKGKTDSYQQNWFVGYHSSVGGGETNDIVANIPLHWVVDQASALGLNMNGALKKYYRGFALGPIYQSLVGVFVFRRGFNSFLRMIPFANRLAPEAKTGTRRLTGYPDSAAAELHPSVIERICADTGDILLPDDTDLVPAPYRPDNVKYFIEAKADPSAYLKSLNPDKPELHALPKDGWA